MRVKEFRLFLASICSAFLAIGSIFTTNKAAFETKATGGGTILSVSPKSGYFTGTKSYMQEISWDSLDVTNSGTEEVNYLVANTSICSYFSTPNQIYSAGKVIGAQRNTSVGLYSKTVKRCYLTALSIKIAFSTDSTYETSSTDQWFIRFSTYSNNGTTRVSDTNKLTLSQIRSIYGNADSSGYYTIPLSLGDNPFVVGYERPEMGAPFRPARLLVESTIPYGLKTVAFTVNTSMAKLLQGADYRAKLGFSYGTTNGVVTEINDVSLIIGLSLSASHLNAAFSSLTSITASIRCGQRMNPGINYVGDPMAVAGDSSNIIINGDEALIIFRISNIPPSAFGRVFAVMDLSLTGVAFYGDSVTIEFPDSDFLSVQDLVEAYQTTAASTLSEEQASLVDSFANFYSDALSN